MHHAAHDSRHAYVTQNNCTVYCVLYTSDVVCEISKNVYTFALDSEFLYCTTGYVRMIETCSVQIIIKYRLCRKDRIILFVRLFCNFL